MAWKFNISEGKMAAALNLRLGDKYGLLTIISLVAHPHEKRRAWLCRCDCGIEKIVTASKLRAGYQLSCGCEGKRRRAIFAAAAVTTHGHSRSLQYVAWQLMVNRCRNPKSHGYHRYGGRGIKVCDRWYNYENFLSDMGERPDGMSLDRINNNRDYEPENCRWATQKEQMRNFSGNRRIKVFGLEKTLAEWSEFSGNPRGRIANRLHSGWSSEAAVLTGMGVPIG